jgi:pilus assembly protein CpaF
MVAVRAQVASAIHLVVCCDRLSDGSRKLTHVSEVLPLSDKGDYRTQDLFVFTQTGKDPKTGKVRGYHGPTGILPTFLSRMRAYGFDDVDEAFFDPSTYKVPPPPIFRHDGEVRTRWAPSLKHRESGEADPDGLMEQFPLPVEPEPVPAPPRARDPEPKELERSPLTTETPAAGIPAQPIATPPKPPSALTQPPRTVAPAPAGPAIDDEERTNAEAAVKRAPPAPTMDEPSIQIADDLLDDLQKVVSHDQTYVKQNPLATKPKPPSNPPAARPAAPVPETDDLEVVEDDRTDPHIRMPQK